jgi:tetratricopeptide (TPR) repeat protein
MKKILFGLLFVYSFAFSLEINAEKSTVTTDVGKTELNQEKDTKEIGLKKVEGLDLITILVENGNYELANNLLMTLDEEEKKTKKYYENRAKINNGLGKKDDAIRDYNYILDNFQDIDKLYYDFEILKVYVTD